MAVNACCVLGECGKDQPYPSGASPKYYMQYDIVKRTVN